MTHKTDFLIIGAGIMGLTIARALRKAEPTASITVCDKEHEVAAHASGRNSGVLHAGFYYSSDSLKAKFTRQGNLLMRQYCAERNIPVLRCGKLVPAVTESELPVLRELYQRGTANQVPLQWLDAAEAKSIEPRVRCVGHALFSPSTASVNPRQVMQHLLNDAVREKINVRWGQLCVPQPHQQCVMANGTRIDYGYLINAAGLYADRIAHAYGVAQDLTILPFKGVYLLGSQQLPLRTHIYTVPNLKQPFLGVHATVGFDGSLKLGPTAMPAFWREHYRGLAGFNWRESAAILCQEARLMCRSQFGFRQLAFKELQYYLKKNVVKSAARLVEGLSPEQFQSWGRPGIRAQLLNKKTRNLVSDFTVTKSKHELHILNAVSPAFTCSMAMANAIIEQILEHAGACSHNNLSQQEV
jgi:L-2-hydroxyglutarate oxidase